MTLGGVLLIVLFLLAMFGGAGLVLWLVFGRGRKGRAEDRAAGGFLDKMAFLRGGKHPSDNRFGK